MTISESRHDGVLTRVAPFVVRRPWLVIGIWIAAVAVLSVYASRVQREFDVAARIKNSEATAVDSVVSTVLSSPFAQYAVLVVSGVPSPDSLDGLEILEQIVAAIDAVPGVSGTLSYLSAFDTLFRGPGEHGGTYVIVGLDASRDKVETMIPRLRRVTAGLRDSIARSHPAVTMRWGGSAPINVDIRSTSAAEAREAELRVLPLTLLLLFLAFGALAASLLPLVAAAIAIISALGLAALIDMVWPLSILLQNMASMIGLGVGIDYALLTVSRFREARSVGRDVNAAAIDASVHAGGMIALSGAAVCVGFGALLLVPVNEMRSMGLGGMLVVATSVLVALTFLPALLAILGYRVDAGRFLRGPSRGGPLQALWRTWGTHVVSHPAIVLVVATVVLGPLAWQATRLEAKLPRGNWLARGLEAGLAIGDLNRMHRGGVVNTVRVLVELRDATLYTGTGWTVVRRVARALEADARIARVVSVTGLPGDSLSASSLELLPPSSRRTLMSPDARMAVIEAVPRDSLDFTVVTALVRELRASDLIRRSASEGARVRVGGIAALSVDYDDAINARRVRIVGLVVALTLLALMIGFRSVLVPIKAVALNLLSVAVAFGAVVLVFQDGYGIRALGLDAPLNGVFAAIPILTFCIVFGLSMDYEIFLVSRVAEARRRLTEQEAIVEGLERTGGVITSAAAIMMVVFGAFALGNFLFIKILGFALAVAVFVDATFVRMAVGPALLALAGRWNWWPADRQRVSLRHHEDASTQSLRT